MGFAVAGVALVTLVAAIALWPSGDDTGPLDPAALGEPPVAATVRGVDIGPCAGTSRADGIDCRLVRIALEGGPQRGETETLEQSVDSGPAPLEAGDQILVTMTSLDDGTFAYSFYDYQRGRPMLVLGAIFVAAVLLLGRWKGLGALGGLAASLLVLVLYVLPSLLAGSDAVAVALVGAAVIAFIALFLAHGVAVGTAVALLGTFASLALTGVLAWVFVRAANFTGFVDESSFFLQALGAGVDAQGILLAGIVIGSLGVLDDVTVTQVSAVWELRSAPPELTRWAIPVGDQHRTRSHLVHGEHAVPRLRRRCAPAAAALPRGRAVDRVRLDSRGRGDRGRPCARRFDRTGGVGADHDGARCTRLDRRCSTSKQPRRIVG